MPEYAIFISYRRSDAAGHARALHRDLCRRFDVGTVFFDRESIESGQVFPARLREAVEQCKVLLALIAPGWLEAKDDEGRRRLDDPADFVRTEIGLALESGCKVIPILFDDTPPAAAARLPAPLAALAACDALTLRGKNYEYDVQIEELVRLLASTPGVPAAHSQDESIAIRTPTGYEVYGG